jgi:hypothetical protein
MAITAVRGVNNRAVVLKASFATIIYKIHTEECKETTCAGHLASSLTTSWLVT